MLRSLSFIGELLQHYFHPKGKKKKKNSCPQKFVPALGYISFWTSLTSRPSFVFPYFFHFSSLHWLFFSILSLGGKRSSLGDHQHCMSTFNWSLSPGSSVKESKAQALCWAQHCLHSFIKTDWYHKASEGSSMVLVGFSLTVVLLIHLLMETLYLLNLYCLE